jgi:hypothetical protein
MTLNDPHVDTGTTGAYRQSWRQVNLRELLARLIADEPDWDEAELKAEFLNIVSGDEQLIRAAIHYAFDNAYRSYLRGLALDARRGRSTGQQAEEEAEEPTPAAAAEMQQASAQNTPEARQARRSALVAAIEARFNVMLLDMIMPNGKQLGDCTREELIDFGTGYVRVGEQLQPGQTPRQAGLTEEAVRDLM